VYTFPPFTTIAVTPFFAASGSFIKLIMKITCVTRLATGVLLSVLASLGAHAADDKRLLQLATCQKSLTEWQKSSPKVEDFMRLPPQPL